MRETRALKKCKGDTVPAKTICIDTKLVLGVDARKKGPMAYRAEQVSMCRVMFGKGEFTISDSCKVSPNVFISLLEKGCRKGSSTWIVGRGIYAQLVAIGLFDRIDNINWSMSNITEEGEEKTSGENKRPWKGFIVIEDKVTIVVIRKVGGGVIHVVDVSNYAANMDSKWSEDIITNVEIVAHWWASWCRWCREAGAGSIKYTLGSQAMQMFRRQHLHFPVVVHTHEKALALEGAALLGGRCEAFAIGKISGPVYHLDARSMYGSVAESNCVPCSLTGYYELGDAGRFLADDGVIADVDISTTLPEVPVRTQSKDLTVFPVGSFRTTLCSPELAFVREYITKVHSVAVYRMLPLFRGWAQDMWRRRNLAELSLNKVIGGQLKVMSQILYGKFAQRRRGWRHEPNEPPVAPWSLWWSLDRSTQKTEAWRSIAGRAERHVDGGWTDQACPAISAWIASLGRAWLWRTMLAAGLGEVYYVDTDSLFVSKLGFDRLNKLEGVISSNLGGLRVEGEYSELEIRGWKHYVADGKLTCAGLSKRSRAMFGTPAGPPTIEPITNACNQKRPPLPIPGHSGGQVNCAYRHGRVWPDGVVTPHIMTLKE